jgi:hypothetical protein
MSVSQQARQRQQQRRQWYIAQGLCSTCGQCPPQAGYRQCAACYTPTGRKPGPRPKPGLPCPRCGSTRTRQAGHHWKTGKQLITCTACGATKITQDRAAVVRKPPCPPCERCGGTDTRRKDPQHGYCRACGRTWTFGKDYAPKPLLVRTPREKPLCRQCGQRCNQYRRQFCSTACTWAFWKAHPERNPLNDRRVRAKYRIAIKRRMAEGDTRLSPAKWAKGDRWAMQYDACLRCGRTDRPHMCRGLCKHCHEHARRHIQAEYRRLAREQAWQETLDIFRRSVAAQDAGDTALMARAS